MIEIKDISFGYGGKLNSVFKDFSLTIEPGRIYGLLGKNGTGKSTLLYLIAGLLRPFKGEVTVDGIAPQLRLPETLQDMFIVPEEFELPKMTLEQYVRINAPFYPRFSWDDLERNLRDFELPTTLNLGALSMGQKKKVYMSFALATNTKLLLMDEPTNGLDIPAKGQFRKVISSSMNDERTILISTHQVGDVNVLLDYVTIIERSRLLTNCSTAEISRLLCFDQRPMGAPTDDALYAYPYIGGHLIVRTNTESEETPLNLELLFNAVHADPHLLQKARKIKEETAYYPH
jgi:ABC-2 type transport system ATP-binding protein